MKFKLRGFHFNLKLKFLFVPVMLLGDLVSVNSLIILSQTFGIKNYNNAMISSLKLNVKYFPVNVELNLITTLVFFVVIIMLMKQ